MNLAGLMFPSPAHRRARTRVLTLMCLFAVATGTLTAASPRSDAATLGGYEIPTIADSNYAIPAGAVFVSSSGNDANAGTSSSPKKTVSAAVTAAPSGGTVVVRAGTYRGSIGVVTKRITIQAYPHEKVWMKGSTVTTGFVTSGAFWKRSWTSTLCATCYASTALDPLYPAAGSPEQIFLSGIPLTEVTNQSGLGAGKFWLDRTTATMWIGSSPTNKTVEITTHRYFVNFASAAAGSALKGVGISHFGSHYNTDLPAMVISSAANTSFDRNTFAWSASRGLAVFAAAPTITNNLFVNNGMNGLLANTADGMSFTGNRISASNVEHFAIAAASTAVVAAAKITSTRGAMFSNNIFSDNIATGLWFDISTSLLTIVHNTSVRNASHGFQLELSADVTLADNVSANNARDGIRISGSNRIEVWHNTVVNNGYSQIGVYEDARTNTNATQIAQGITWDTAAVRVKNNVVMAGANSARPVFYSFDLNVPVKYSTLTMVTADDRNIWGRTSSITTKYAASIQLTLTSKGTYTTFPAWVTGTGRELKSAFADNTALSTIFVDTAAGNYALATTAPSVYPGSLPTTVKTALGVAAVAKIGAYGAPIA